jgi:hypothetical protein
MKTVKNVLNLLIEKMLAYVAVIVALAGVASFFTMLDGVGSENAVEFATGITGVGISCLLFSLLDPD